MCLAPKLTLPAAPPPLPTAQDRSVVAAKALQRKRQQQAGGYNGQTLLTGDQFAKGLPPGSAMKTLLGG